MLLTLYNVPGTRTIVTTGPIRVLFCNLHPVSSNSPNILVSLQSVLYATPCTFTHSPQQVHSLLQVFEKGGPKSHVIYE